MAAEYLILITGRELRGRLMGHDVYRAIEFDILPMNPNGSVASPPHPVEGHLLALLRSHLNGGVFLFSHGWDLTRRLQAQWETQQEDQDKGRWEVVCRVVSEYAPHAHGRTGRRQIFLEQVSTISSLPDIFIDCENRFVQNRLIDASVKQDVSVCISRSSFA